MAPGNGQGSAGQAWPYDALPDYAFPRLRALLDDSTPGAEPIDLSLGEPRHPFPSFVADILSREVAGFGRYPPAAGTPGLLAAATGWATRRYGLPADWLDPGAHITALNGTREGLFMATQTVATEKHAGTDRPAILMPNPFYQCYAAASLAIHAEPVFLNTTQATGHLPDLNALSPDLLDRTLAFYLCSPANPQGAVADRAYWSHLLDLAHTHDFVIFADECYAEVYDDAPPPGILEAAAAWGSAPDRVLAFHSLSKRSNLPGLRSGFVAGDAALIGRLKKLKAYGGAPSPLPVCAAAAAAWRDDVHVAENRRLYRTKVDLAADYLGGHLDFFRPPGGFFLWLNTGKIGLGGEEAAHMLWQKAGVRVLPGAFLSRTTADGNPGHDYIRLALVHDESVTKEALSRLVATVGL